MPPLRFVASLSNDLKSSANVFCISRPLDSRFQKIRHKKTLKGRISKGSGIKGFNLKHLFPKLYATYLRKSIRQNYNKKMNNQIKSGSFLKS